MSYTFISNSDLAELIRGEAVAGKDFVVIDVRDEDFEGGNIVGAIRAPSEETTEESVKELVASLQETPRVIFHCALSQVRGPTAAKIYARERERQHSHVNIKQSVEVLRGGFTEFQSLFRNDKILVENHDAKIWGSYAQ